MKRALLAPLFILMLVSALFAAVPARAATAHVVIDIDDAQSSYVVPAGAMIWTAAHTPYDTSAANLLRLVVQPKTMVSEGLIADYLPPSFVASLNLSPGQHILAYTYLTKTPGDFDIIVQVGHYDRLPQDPWRIFVGTTVKTIHVHVQ